MKFNKFKQSFALSFIANEIIYLLIRASLIDGSYQEGITNIQTPHISKQWIEEISLNQLPSLPLE
ncbi:MULTISPECIES: hypothetical protein [Sphingobacterium]|uniref:hypothetical protein n=1 Tax=Sphingobacterium TaxID=28453 RepID=UPI0011B25202|nr:MULTISPECIES: hypothetical protein [Sphingobacterium]QIH32358.1 hypothetical protein G6053_05380 [Sphingobacterium sp. DR205]